MNWFENVFKDFKKDTKQQAEEREEMIKRITETPESLPRSLRLDRLNEEAKAGAKIDSEVIPIEEDATKNMSVQQIYDEIVTKQNRIKSVQDSMSPGMTRTPADTRLIDQLNDDIAKLRLVLDQRQQG